MNTEVNFRLYHECYGEHKHEYPQILVPLSSTLHIQINDKEYDVSTRELCFIPQGAPHECDFSGDMMVINLTDVATEWKTPILQTYPLIIPIRDQIMQLVNLIHTELQQNADSQSVRYLYNFLYSKLAEHCGAPSIRYIREYYHLPITIEQLARIENYDATYYTDWFKHRTGMLPSLYLRQLRIGRAKELLENTNFSVMQIASMVGYSSNATLTRAFRSVTGISPREYRENIHHGAAVS
ncbi:MAG: helix-turn-helix domain-containing protein [Butyricicoccus sp.]|nr:helix-turn-helix domain-containing protein [Butyricicoccus sp.]